MSWAEGEDVWEEVRDSDKIMLALVGYGRASGFYSEREWMEVRESFERVCVCVCACVMCVMCVMCFD